MTKHQKLMILRHLRSAERTYQGKLNNGSGMSRVTAHELEIALQEVQETILVVEKMDTKD